MKPPRAAWAAGSQVWSSGELPGRSRPAWSLVQQEPSADSGTWWQSPSSLAFKWVSCSWLLPWQEARLQGTLSLPGLTAHSPPSLHGRAPDHNVTVLPFPRALWGPGACSAALPLQPSSGGCSLGLLFPVSLGAVPAVPSLLHCATRVLTPLPSASPFPLLPAPGCFSPRAFSVVRKLWSHHQAWGVGRQVSRPPTLQQDSASPRPHTAMGAGARPQGCRQPCTQPDADVQQCGPWCWMRLSRQGSGCQHLGWSGPFLFLPGTWVLPSGPSHTGT